MKTAILVMVFSTLPLFAQTDLAYESSAAGMFYDALAPYGNWVWASPCGWSWYPNDIPIGWRPYTDGYWDYTDYGWTWVSNHPWGWACDHYGRWSYDPTYGWIWCPGTVWAPAWVCWRANDEVVGWAPLPPECQWTGSGFTNVEIINTLPVFSFVFVDIDHFHDHDLHRRFHQFGRNVTFFRSTRPVIDIGVHNDRIINSLPVQDRFVKRAGRVEPRKLTFSDSFPVVHEPKPGELRIFRPDTATLRSGHALQKVSPEVHTFPDIAKRHEELRRSIEQQQKSQEASLEEFHRRELQTAPPAVNRQAIESRQQAERAAQAQEAGRQLELLNRYHEHEARVLSAPGTPPVQQRFAIPSQPSPAVRPQTAVPQTRTAPVERGPSVQPRSAEPGRR